MKTLALVFVPFALLFVQQILAARTNHDRILLSENFGKGAKSVLAKNLLSNRYVSLAQGAGPDGSDAIRVSYVGFEKGSKRVVLHHPFGTEVVQAALSFDVKFDKDFQWTYGGKLHGLGPKHPVTGGLPRRSDGWSARMTFKQDGRCATYLYDQDETKKWVNPNFATELVCESCSALELSPSYTRAISIVLVYEGKCLS